jgi:hypothetical protein
LCRCPPENLSGRKDAVHELAKSEIKNRYSMKNPENPDSKPGEYRNQ